MTRVWIPAPALALSFALALAFGCASEDDGGGFSDVASCAPGQQIQCTCPDRTPGTLICGQAGGCQCGAGQLNNGITAQPGGQGLLTPDQATQMSAAAGMGGSSAAPVGVGMEQQPAGAGMTGGDMGAAAMTPGALVGQTEETQGTAQDEVTDPVIEEEQEVTTPEPVVEEEGDVPPGCPTDWDPMWAQFEQEVLLLTNEARAAGHNCDTQGQFPATEPLTMNATLRCSARLHSQDMGENGYFAHDSLDGRSPFDRMADAGYSGSTMGENIAMGQQTPADVVAGWLDSDGHCANIMRSSFTEIGVGYWEGEATNQFFNNNKLWTQNFGAPGGGGWRL